MGEIGRKHVLKKYRRNSQNKKKTNDGWYGRRESQKIIQKYRNDLCIADVTEIRNNFNTVSKICKTRMERRDRNIVSKKMFKSRAGALYTYFFLEATETMITAMLIVG